MGAEGETWYNQPHQILHGEQMEQCVNIVSAWPAISLANADAVVFPCHVTYSSENKGLRKRAFRGKSSALGRRAVQYPQPRQVEEQRRMSGWECLSSRWNESLHVQGTREHWDQAEQEEGCSFVLPPLQHLSWWELAAAFFSSPISHSTHVTRPTFKDTEM